MAWSLSVRETRNPELVDALLLAAGKSLYIANGFEAKCKSVLRVFDLVQAYEADPVQSLEELFTASSPAKMLGKTIQGILTHDDIGDPAAVLRETRPRR